MPRIQTVKKSRKAHGNCSRCREELPAGSAYQYIEFAFGPTVKRCMKHECRFRASDLTRSEIKGQLYSAVETFEDSEFEIAADVIAGVETLAEQVAEVVELIQEKLDAIEEGMGHTEVPVYEELEMRREELEGWWSELEEVGCIDEEDLIEEAKMDLDDEDATDDEVDEASLQLARDRADEVVCNNPE